MEENGKSFCDPFMTRKRHKILTFIFLLAFLVFVQELVLATTDRIKIPKDLSFWEFFKIHLDRLIHGFTKERALRSSAVFSYILSTSVAITSLLMLRHMKFLTHEEHYRRFLKSSLLEVFVATFGHYPFYLLFADLPENYCKAPLLSCVFFAGYCCFLFYILRVDIFFYDINVRKELRHKRTIHNNRLKVKCIKRRLKLSWDGVQIVKSGPFEIELQNHNNKTWNGKNYYIRKELRHKHSLLLRFWFILRHDIYSTEIIQFNLPDDLKLAPGKSVKLMPESQPLTEGSIHIKGYRSFGRKSAEDVMTWLAKPNMPSSKKTYLWQRFRTVQKTDDLKTHVPPLWQRIKRKLVKPMEAEKNIV